MNFNYLNFKKDFSFFEIQKESKISVIFPSILLLKKEYGDSINKSDFVVRFNDYKIEGFEKYIGNKTDLHVSNYETYKYKHFNKYDKNIKILMVTRASVDFRKIINKDIKNINYNDLLNVIKNKYSKDILNPTAGFSLLVTLLEFGFKNIDLYGFEKRNSIGENYTYYHKKTDNIKHKRLNNSYHNFKIENDIISKMNINIIKYD